MTIIITMLNNRYVLRRDASLEISIAYLIPSAAIGKANSIIPLTMICIMDFLAITSRDTCTDTSTFQIIEQRMVCQFHYGYICKGFIGFLIWL